MRNTSETDYVLKCNHVSADWHFDSLVTREFCPGQTTPSAYLRKKMSLVLHLKKKKKKKTKKNVYLAK